MPLPAQPRPEHLSRKPFHLAGWHQVEPCSATGVRLEYCIFACISVPATLPGLHDITRIEHDARVSVVTGQGYHSLARPLPVAARRSLNRDRYRAESGEAIEVSSASIPRNLRRSTPNASTESPHGSIRASCIPTMTFCQWPVTRATSRYDLNSQSLRNTPVACLHS